MKFQTRKNLLTALSRMLFLCAILITSSAGFAADQKDIERVSAKLSCFCGCPHLVVNQCGCGTAAKIMADVGTMIDKGMTDQQIVQNYVDRYGLTVLSSPPKSGFSLTAYLIPFVAFFVGGTVLVAFLKHQGNGKGPDQDQKTQEPLPPSNEPEDRRYNEMLNNELDKRK